MGIIMQTVTFSLESSTIVQTTENCCSPYKSVPVTSTGESQYTEYLPPNVLDFLSLLNLKAKETRSTNEAAASKMAESQIVRKPYYAWNEFVDPDSIQVLDLMSDELALVLNSNDVVHEEVVESSERVHNVRPEFELQENMLTQNSSHSHSDTTDLLRTGRNHENLSDVEIHEKNSCVGNSVSAVEVTKEYGFITPPPHVSVSSFHESDHTYLLSPPKDSLYYEEKFKNVKISSIFERIPPKTAKRQSSYNQSKWPKGGKFKPGMNYDKIEEEDTEVKKRVGIKKKKNKRMLTKRKKGIQSETAKSKKNSKATIEETAEISQSLSSKKDN